MFRGSSSVRALIVASIALIGSASAWAGLVDGSDARAQPMKDAVAALVKPIVAGDFEKARGEWVGDKRDGELFEKG